MFYCGNKQLFCFYTLEAKCYCTHPLLDQQNTSLNASNEIICEKNGGIPQPNGECDADEYCAGPNHLEEAVCGKRKLCTNKGLQ